MKHVIAQHTSGCLCHLPVKSTSLTLFPDQYKVLGESTPTRGKVVLKNGLTGKFVNCGEDLYIVFADSTARKVERTIN